MAALLEVREAVFGQEVLESEVPVLVYFWAPWCEPCRELEPEVEAAAESLLGKARFMKINIDDDYPVLLRYGVTNIPVLLLFKSGAVVDSIDKLVSRSVVEQMLRRHLA